MRTSRRGRRAVALLLAGSFAFGGCAAQAGAPAQPSPPAAAAPSPAAAPTPGAAFYTTGQADQGRLIFNSVCSTCHSLNEFRGQLFRTTWMTRPVGDFFEHISTAMPEDNPGGLPAGQYLAVVAYVLQLNGAVAGATPLPADARVLGTLAWPR